MQSQHPPLETIQDIKRMMERSSRFISLSGWSGVSAGICALIGAWAGHERIDRYLHGTKVVTDMEYPPGERYQGGHPSLDLMYDLVLISIITFVAAFVSAFLFTYLRSRRDGVPIWGRTVQRLAWNTILPMAVGGLLIVRAVTWEYYELVAPGCLIFYGLALVNASKYTLGEIRYLGYGQLILGIINLWYIGAGLYLWAIGFGILHIIYGGLMWWKYERSGR